jgi:hypothetical protein
MRWLPDTLTAARKVTQRERAAGMFQTLESHTASNFHFLWIGDESWMFHKCHHETMWAVSWEKVNELEWPTHDHKNTVVIAFLNGIGERFLNILLRGRSVETSYFAGETIAGPEDVCSPEGKDRH